MKYDPERHTGIVEHNDNIVGRDVDICEVVNINIWLEDSTQTRMGRKVGLEGAKLVCMLRIKCDNHLPLSMPSAPSRTAASKLARVFSG